MVDAAQGRRADAVRIIAELQRVSAPLTSSTAHLIARIHATLHDHDEALTWLERGLREGAIPIFYKDAPMWDPFRADPRFVDLLRRMGIG